MVTWPPTATTAVGPASPLVFLTTAPVTVGAVPEWEEVYEEATVMSANDSKLSWVTPPTVAVTEAMYVPGAAYEWETVGTFELTFEPSPKLKTYFEEVSPFVKEAVKGTVVPAWVVLNGTRRAMSCPASKLTQM